MSATPGARLVLAFAVTALAVSGVLTAAQKTRVHAFIAMVADVHRDGPNDAGMLPTALAEAETAAREAALAASSLQGEGSGSAQAQLECIKVHTRNLLHAIDPREVPEGPGLRYGVRAAAANSASLITTAAKTEGASPSVVTQANHIATSARNTVARAEQLIAVSKQILAASSLSGAAPLLPQMKTLADQLVAGADANGDGQIGWQENEGGLRQAQQHMTLLKKAEGLP